MSVEIINSRWPHRLRSARSQVLTAPYGPCFGPLLASRQSLLSDCLLSCLYCHCEGIPRRRGRGVWLLVALQGGCPGVLATWLPVRR